MAKYLKTWDGTLAENRFHRLTTLGLLGLALVLGGGLMVKDTTVVLIPPNLDARGEVSSAAASEDVKVAWGMYLATLFGNVTPKTVGFLTERVGQHLSPRMYRPVLEALDKQSKEIQQENLTISFAPSLARWEPTSQRVIVTGEMSTRGVRDEERRITRTYELGFVVQNYRVLLDDLKVYEGSWKRESAQEN
jgi:conjugal transfer pilus assembly protein TraE